jgi:hypothetical protein
VFFNFFFFFWGGGGAPPPPPPHTPNPHFEGLRLPELGKCNRPSYLESRRLVVF